MNLRIEQDGRLRRIALAAVEKRNLLDAAMCEELLDELRDAVADDAVGAILLEATNNRQRLELYREDVAPHRPGGGTEMDFEEMTQTF